MKHITFSSLIALAILFTSVLQAQRMGETAGGEFVHNPSGTPCVTPEDYDLYHTLVAENIADLAAKGKRVYDPNRSAKFTGFEWPVAQAPGFNYNNSWGISVYFDHDPATGQLEDWNCGDRTYDTSGGYNHQGVDIFLWPFSWQQVDEGRTEVVSAADGQIVFKNDGNFDMNCDFNSEQWNAIYVEHADGSIAWYGHMKNGSLNSKNVGDMVVAGERLGIIASSGNSTGPHLHFEVYDETGTLIDPYAGPCNDSNPTSWWNDQKEYLNTGINAVLTHTDLPDFGSCPDIETTNVSNQFDLGSEIWFIGYYIDQVTGTTALNEVYDPNGAIFASWDTNFNDDFASSWWAQRIAVSQEEGIWTYSITYNGETVSYDFRVGALSIETSSVLELKAYPNPTSGVFELSTGVPLKDIYVHDLQGRVVLEQHNVNNVKATIDLSNMASSLYFITANGLDTSAKVTLRVLKQ